MMTLLKRLKIFKHVLIVCLFLGATVPSSFLSAETTSEPPICLSLEGIPIPNCKYSRFHTCNSGGPSFCTYAKLKTVIRTFDNPSVGECASAMVCTRNCVNGPDGQVCSQSCVCPDPRPVTTVCRQNCNKCIDDGAEFNSGVYCPEFCATPLCPGAIEVSGIPGVESGVYQRYGTDTPLCGTVTQCTPVHPGDPTICEERIPEPQQFPPSCCHCFDAGNVPAHAAGINRCDEALCGAYSTRSSGRPSSTSKSIKPKGK